MQQALSASDLGLAGAAIAGNSPGIIEQSSLETLVVDDTITQFYVTLSDSNLRAEGACLGCIGLEFRVALLKIPQRSFQNCLLHFTGERARRPRTTQTQEMGTK